MEYDYERLLEDARKNLPESTLKTERFEIPKAKGLIEGNKTIITNFYQIANIFGRDTQHLLKFLLRELATPGEISNQRLILKRKLSSSLINTKIEQYANTFVICRECKKPDTQLIKQDKVLFLKCMAFGAKHSFGKAELIYG